VATVAYGTPLADELDVLRAWRDQRLRQTWLGKKFIRMYYRYGERLAAWVGKSERLKACCRWMIRLIVERVAKGVNID
jgi:antibiotic biosynthesis monooxygenase (ABM) superfamily enzyme